MPCSGAEERQSWQEIAALASTECDAAKLKEFSDEFFDMLYRIYQCRSFSIGEPGTP